MKLQRTILATTKKLGLSTRKIRDMAAKPTKLERENESPT